MIWILVGMFVVQIATLGLLNYHLRAIQKNQAACANGVILAVQGDKGVYIGQKS